MPEESTQPPAEVAAPARSSYGDDRDGRSWKIVTPADRAADTYRSCDKVPALPPDEAAHPVPPEGLLDPLTP